MGDNLVSYRTFVALGSLGSPSYSVYREALVARATRSTADHVTLSRPSRGPTGSLRGFLPQVNYKSSQGFYCVCNQPLGLRSPGHVRVRNNRAWNPPPLVAKIVQTRVRITLGYPIKSILC
jgi:hypothetical protein